MADEKKCGWCPLGYSGCSQYRDLEKALETTLLEASFHETESGVWEKAQRIEIENHDLKVRLERAVRLHTEEESRRYAAEAQVDRLRDSLWVLAYPPWIEAAPGLRSWVLNQVRSGIPLLDPEQRKELEQHLEGPDRFIRNEPGGERCVKCGKHIREHYGGTEYRCYPKEEA